MKFALVFPAWAVLALAACSSSSSSSSGATPDGGEPSDGPGGPGTGTGGSDAGGSDTGGTVRDASAPDSRAAVAYEHHVIGFDDLPDTTKVTSQYATWAVFASDPGCACEINANDGYAASPPSYIWTYYTCANGDTASYFIDFAKPIRNFKVKFVGINDTTRIATIRLVKSDKSVSPHDVIGIDNKDMVTPADLTGQSDDVIRVEIVNVTDSDGLGVDDVEFDFPK